MGQLGFASQFREQCAVVNHGLPEISGACESMRVAYRNVVAGSVMFNDERMVDRNIRGTLLEVRHGIAPRRHDGLNQFVGLGERAAQIVDKSRLNPLPRRQEVRAIRGR
jgi:hypothetical protein